MVAQYSTYVQSGARFKDLTGLRFGRLVALEPVRKSGRVQVAWRCKCDCGAEKIVDGWHLRGGLIRSCGCYMRERCADVSTTHGKTGSRVYGIFNGMHNRCSLPKHKDFKGYGARGISVDPRWDKFENFLADMGDPPEGMSLDRIDTFGNYGPTNCRWATPSQQTRNKRNNRWVEFNGEKLTITDLAKRSGISRATLTRRLKQGSPIDVAVTQDDWRKVRK